ncbi:MAG: MarC family protein [Opitutaceae bacterium]|jgi:multiple antibiotic resistance protein|nr:MarC family protein [Opitutaceae bacterium]
MNDLISIYLKMMVLYTPFFGLSCFLAMSREHTQAERRHMAWRVALAVLVSSVALFLFGRFIFMLFGITADAFRIGAGSVLFLSALAMAQGKTPVENKEARHGIVIVPLTIPVIVGPGTIGALLVMGVNQTFNARLISLAGIALASITIGLMLFLSDRISRLLGDAGLQIVSRLTGLFVCALAAQIIFTGIKGYY